VNFSSSKERFFKLAIVHQIKAVSIAGFVSLVLIGTPSV